MDSGLLQSDAIGLLLADSLDERVEFVLDLVLCAAWNVLRDQGPLVPELLLPSHQDQLLKPRPLVSLDVWTQEVDPPLATLLPLPPRAPEVLIDLVSNILPLLLPMLFYELSQDFVFLDSPRQLLRLLFVLRLPLVVALVVVSARHEFGDVLPILHGLAMMVV